MKLKFGRYHNKHLEDVVIDYGDYVSWMLGCKTPFQELQALLPDVRRLVTVFDSKPILLRCQKPGCGADATCIAITQSHRGVRACATCQIRGEIYRIKSYGDAWLFTKLFRDDPRLFLRTLVRELAYAKGLPKRARYSDRKQFFVIRNAPLIAPGSPIIRNAPLKAPSSPTP